MLSFIDGAIVLFMLCCHLLKLFCTVHVMLSFIDAAIVAAIVLFKVGFTN